MIDARNEDEWFEHENAQPFVVENGVIRAAMDETVEHAASNTSALKFEHADKLLMLEEARTTVNAVESRILEAMRTEYPSDAMRFFVTTVNESGAELMLGLMNAGNRLPETNLWGDHAARLRSVDENIFPQFPQFVDTHSVAVDDLVSSLQLHAQAMHTITPNTMVQHNDDLIDGAFAVWSMIGLSVESEGGMALTEHAQRMLDSINVSMANLSPKA